MPLSDAANTHGKWENWEHREHNTNTKTQHFRSLLGLG